MDTTSKKTASEVTRDLAAELANAFHGAPASELEGLTATNRTMFILLQGDFRMAGIGQDPTTSELNELVRLTLEALAMKDTFGEDDLPF